MFPEKYIPEKDKDGEYTDTDKACKRHKWVTEEKFVPGKGYRYAFLHACPTKTLSVTMRGSKRLNWVQNIDGGPRDASKGTTGAGKFISQKTQGANTDVEWQVESPAEGQVARFAIQTTYQKPISKHRIRQFLGFKK